MQRIMIFGRSGSGKSTFAHRLHVAIGLPLHHLDRHFFVENWVERDYQEFLNIQRSIIDQDEWIIDGNSIRSLEMRYQRAELCLYFNYPRLICYYRVFKRRFEKKREIADRAPGCSETIKWPLLSYMWSFEKRVVDQIIELRAKYPQVKFIEIKNDKALASVEKQFLQQ